MEFRRRPEPAPTYPGHRGPRAVCSKCGYDAIYRSRLRWYDLPLILLLRPYRCNKCYRRSYGPVWSKV